MDQPSIKPGNNGEKSDLNASIDWFRSLLVMVSALLRLAIAELSLAREDLGRLVVSTLIIIPLMLMTWVTLSLLAAWIVYEQSASATLGFSALAVIHVIAVVVLYKRINSYRRSLLLPVTRNQLMAIVDEIRGQRDQS